MIFQFSKLGLRCCYSRKTGISVSYQHVGILLQLKTGISVSGCAVHRDVAQKTGISVSRIQETRMASAKNWNSVGGGFLCSPPSWVFSFLENQRFLLARKLENHYSKRLPCSLRELRLRALLRKATSPLLPKTEIPCVNFSFRSPVRLKDWILMPAFCLHFSATRFSCNFKTAFSPPPVS